MMRLIRATRAKFKATKNYSSLTERRKLLRPLPVCILLYLSITFFIWAASAGPSKRGGKDMETLKKHNAEHFKRMNEKVAAKGAKKAPKSSYS